MPEVQGVGRPRAIGWQRAAPGTSLRPLSRGSATAVGTAGAWPRGNYDRARETQEQDPPHAPPRPSPHQPPTGSALGMLGTQLGLGALEEELPAGAGDSPVLSPSPFPPALS